MAALNPEIAQDPTEPATESPDQALLWALRQRCLSVPET
ncbi:hypothetical protein F8B43_1174 [Methylorubrum populi]|uniref:Uncharacterized protein n=1 Tax=Methylorubrum populi TaxID=223967 RepID=A0A833J6V1_9HYPH|nr:hypothetical protein F8B43_1174 [Methylorubrum populi]